MKPQITVITPIYNRIEFLSRLYVCLYQQTCHDFEWVVVDDGSNEPVETVLRELQEKSTTSLQGNERRVSFPMVCITKPNGGKHTAINVGVRHAQGELVLILDSDDTLPENAIEMILGHYAKFKNKGDCCGVCGLMAHHDGTRIGTGFGKDILYESSLTLRYQLKVKGDLIEVFKTSVLREIPFPEITGEKFCPEALVWNRIATKYKLYCFNEVVYYRDYLEGGLTDKIVKIRMDSPRASMMTYQELTKYDIPFKDKLKAAVNYWRFRFCAKGDNTPSIDYKWYFAIPLGYLMHLKDIKTTKL